MHFELEEKTNFSIWCFALFLKCVLFVFIFSSEAFADAAIERIVAAQQVRIAADVSEMPFIFRKADGTYDGFEAGLGAEIAGAIGRNVRVKWIPANWGRIGDFVKEGRADLGLNGLFITPNGAEDDWGIYSNPYMKSGMALIYRKQFGALSIKKIVKSGLEVGVLNDPAALDFAAKSGLRTRIFDGQETPLDGLLLKHVPAVVYDWPAVVYFAATHPTLLNYEAGILLGTEQNYGVLLRKGLPDLLQKVNEGIVRWRNSSHVKQRWKSFFLD